MTEWQAIDTAPKDGTAVWLLLDGHPYIGYCEPADWLDDRDRWFAKATDNVYCCHGVDVEPTHWMPLPTPLTGDRS